MPENPKEALQLSPGTQAFIGSVLAGQEGVGLSLWLKAAAERFGLMVEGMVPALASRDLIRRLASEIASGKPGPIADRARIVDLATREAMSRNRTVVAERDLVTALLREGGYQVAAPAVASTPIATAPTAPSTPAVPGSVGSTSQPSPTGDPTTIVRQTPALDRFGRDLTVAARAGKLGPVLERDREIDLVIETLCRRSKPNPLLVGPAGTGKTAIVEGLAQRIAAGTVPARLTNVRLVALQPSALVGGASLVGELQKRMEAIIAEATDPSIVLFIDEIHTIVGAGGSAGTGDLASLLKPVLARGDLACIGATTDDEYRQFIEPDRALERRFNPIRVSELSAQQTLAVLRKIRGSQGSQPPEVSDEVLVWIVDVARQAMPNRRFPDKAIDLLDQITAYGVSHGLAAVGRPEAEEVVRRILGRAFTGGAALDRLDRELIERHWAPALLAEELVDQLRVALRGLDVRPERPNAVVALPGWDPSDAEALGRLVAESVYGDPGRIVVIDLGMLKDVEDVKTLIGSPPSFVGYGDRHALDAVIETPHTVLLLERIDQCHPVVLDLIGPALQSGVMRDARSRKIHLSDAIVFVTLAATGDARRPVIGFATAGAAAAATPAAASLDPATLGPIVSRAVDLTLPAPTAGAGQINSAEWISTELLHTIAGRHQTTGIDLVWDSSIVAWLEKTWSADRDRNHLEHFADHELSAPIVRQLYEPGTVPAGKFLVRLVDGRVQVQPVSA